MSFSEKLKQLRESHNHTQKELSDLLGVQKSAISNYETGRSYPKRLVLMKLAQLYHVPIDSLMDGAGPLKASSPASIQLDVLKKIPVYKNFDYCFTEGKPPAYFITLPPALIGKGNYKAFLFNEILIIVDYEKPPVSGDCVFARTGSGEILYGKYYEKDGSCTIVSKYIGSKEETSLFDIHAEEIEILAVAIKIFKDLTD